MNYDKMRREHYVAFSPLLASTTESFHESVTKRNANKVAAIIAITYRLEVGRGAH